jgi:hypothetical protein
MGASWHRAPAGDSQRVNYTGLVRRAMTIQFPVRIEAAFPHTERDRCGQRVTCACPR